MAAHTGKATSAGPIETFERNILAITRRIVVLEQKARALKKQLAETRANLKRTRRELRIIYQRDSSIGIEDSPMLDAAGKADAVDAAQVQAAERRKP